MLNWLTSHLMLTLAILGALLLLLLGLVVYVVLRALRRSKVQEEQGAEGAEPSQVVSVDLSRSWRLRRSFARGLDKLRRVVFGKDYRYQIPWVLLLGQAGSRPQDLLANAHLSLPLGAPEESEQASTLGCAWWLSDRGVVIDLAGEYVLRADGRSWSEAGFRSFLQLLQHHRPHRPADGVILTLSCAELMAATLDPDALADLERRAGLLADRLMEAQRELGLRLPVWVLVTGCEGLGGFESFVHLLPSEQRDGIFGWSSPYRTDAAFRTEWADEIFSNLGAGLRRAQLGIYARLPPSAAADAVFALPDELDALHEPLRGALGRLFQPSAYQESPFLRGVYFCGTDHAAGSRAAALLAAPPTRFLRDLFEQKIFPESALAVPAVEVVRSRNRRVRLTQALTLLGAAVLFVGTAWTYEVLAARQPPLKRFFVQIQGNLSEMRRRGGGELDDPGRSLDLLETLAHTDLSWYGSLFLPSSWVSPFNRRIERLIVSQFNTLVLPTMKQGLTVRAERLLDGLPATCAAPPETLAPVSTNGETPLPPLAPVAQAPELLEARCYTEELRKLRRHAVLYNDLPSSPGLDELEEVVDYLFDQPLPPDFQTNSTLYRRALKETHGLHLFSLPPSFASSASDLIRTRISRLYQRLFAQNLLRITLKDLGTNLEAAAQGFSESGEEATDRLERLRHALARAEIVGRPELAWVFAVDFDLGPAFDELLTTLASLETPGASDLRMVTPGLWSQVRAAGEQRWSELRDVLLRAAWERQGPTPASLWPTGEGAQGAPESTLPPAADALLERTDGATPQPLPQLSSTLRMLHEVLDDWSRGFPPPKELPGLWDLAPVGMRLYWDPAPLRDREDLLSSYDDFRQKTFELLPEELRSTADEGTRQRLGVRLSKLVDRAQSFRPGQLGGPAFLQAEDLEAEIHSLVAAAPDLQAMLTAFDQLQLDAPRRRLAAVLAAQRERLLREAGSRLEESRLYLPADATFSTWTGEGPAMDAVLAAYGVRDAAGLAAYLVAQRRQLRQLAENGVKPVLQAVPASLAGAEGTDLSRWEDILSALSEYDAQTPGNPLAELESFISEQMPQTVLGSCPLSPATTAQDFFAGRRERLRRGLARRCRERAAAGWEELADLFNRQLRDRSPFSARRPGDLSPAADPASLRAFYRLFDRWEGALRQVLAESLPAPLRARPCQGRQPEAQEPGCEDVQAPALCFLDRMAALREVLAPYLEATEPGAVPTIDFEVDFRVHRDQEPGGERGGNQIIDWSLTAADRTIRDGDPEPRGRWGFGEPVSLSLRWAKDGPRVPAAGLAPAGVAVRDRTVVFAYTDPWALLSLLKDRSAPREDFAALTDLRPHTLKLEIPTVPAGAEEPVEGVRVFIRLRLVDPESKETLRLPLCLPATAPSLGISWDLRAVH